MSFQAFVQCDREGCNSRVQVQQLGALPLGWIQIGYAKTVLNGRDFASQQQAQPVILTLCSWKCGLKIVKQFVTDDVEVARG